MATSALLFGVMGYLTRHVTQLKLSGAQVAFMRFATASSVLVVLIATRRIRVAPKRWDLLAARALLGSAAALVYFVLLEHLPVGTTTLLHYSSPIWATLIAALVLDEHPSTRVRFALTMAMVGVVLVVVGEGRALGGSYFWLTVGIASATLSGGAVVAARAARRENSAWSVFTVFSLVGVVCTAIPAFGDWHPMTGQHLVLCLTIGFVSVIAQVLMTQSLGVLDNATAGTISMLTVLSAMAMGYVFDGERLSTYSWIGAGLTLLGIWLAARVSGSPKTRAGQ